MGFGETFYKLRIDKKLSQREISKKIGISPAALSTYERGEKLPTCEALIKIADFFNISTDKLLDREPIENKYETYGDVLPALWVLSDKNIISIGDVGNSVMRKFLFEKSYLKELLSPYMNANELLELWGKSELAKIEKIVLEQKG